MPFWENAREVNGETVLLEPAIPHDEDARLAALRELNILNTLPEERFDRYTRILRRLLDSSIALVSLVDANRQWFKSNQGLDAEETPREVSFCGHTILGDGAFVVEDASHDERFKDNPLVTDDPNIRFYAGVPLSTPCGHNIGTLCIIDPEPRKFSDEDLATLRDIADMVRDELFAQHVATVDPLTGVSNRRGFEVLGEKALGYCTRYRVPLSLLVIDLDGFKPINDQHGHVYGDRALGQFADIVIQTGRESDMAARLGGDEFAVLLPSTDAAGADVFANRLQAAVDRWNEDTEYPFQLAYSYGIAELGPEHTDLESLICAADAAMFEAKRAKPVNRQALG